MVPFETYHSDGKTYRKKTHSDVNAGHSIEDVQSYVTNLPADAHITARGPETEVPYDSIMDYVGTLRRACGPNSPFIWPHESMLFERALTVASHNLPPGYAMCIQNKRPVPPHLAGNRQDGYHRQPAAVGVEH